MATSTRDSNEEDLDPEMEDLVNQSGAKFVTIHKSAPVHIGIINGPVTIGPQFNFPSAMMQPQNSQQNTDCNSENIQRWMQNLEARPIENEELKAIAQHISDDKLPDLCQLLQVPDSKLRNWLQQNSTVQDGKEYDVAHKMLYYWVQTNDLVRIL